MRTTLIGSFCLLATITSTAAVPRPWTPIRATDNCVSVWGRDYHFASNAMPVRVTSLGRDLLAAPIRIVCEDQDGKTVEWKKGGCWEQGVSDEAADIASWQSSPTVTADVTSHIEFDGMAKVALALVAGPNSNTRKIRKAYLEIPMRPEIAKLYALSPASWSKLDNVGGIHDQPLAWPFRCSVWVGDEKAGFCWFCESDENLAKSDKVVEIIPGAKETVVRIHLTDDEIELPKTWVFGLEATPCKPYDPKRVANHFLHSPKMGVGLTIKRPEVWWTAQRAFPKGNIEATLDKAKASGVNTVAFHEDWIPVQNNLATARPEFKAIVDACHRRGIKAIVYQGYELSPLDPMWGELQRDCLTIDENGRTRSWWYREPAQRDFNVCYASRFARVWLDRVKANYDKLGIDGFYFDGTIMPRLCANERHGCGWRDAKGKLHGRYPFFAVRKMMRELYEFVDGRGGWVDAHQSGYICPATLAFAHSYWDGEQLACSKQDIKRMLNLEAFRAEFMGINHGVPSEFLCYEIPGKWSYDDAMALTLLHNVMVRPCGFGSEARLAPYWNKLDAFGIADAKWLPYWESPLKVTPESVKASVYEKDGKRLAVISNLSPDNEVTAEVEFPTGKRSLKLPPFRAELIEY